MLETIKKRRDFLAAAKAAKFVTPFFVLQCRRRSDDSNLPRVGYTVSKKVGNAVTRNRAKRRLRAAVALSLQDLALPMHDYVLVGRAGKTVDVEFDTLVAELDKAVRAVHKKI